MDKSWFMLLILVALLLTGCTSSVFEVPDEFKDAYIQAASEYMSSKYPDIELEDAHIGVYNTHSAVNNYSICVTFKTEEYTSSFEVWNVLTYPLDNVNEVLYRDDAYELIQQKAEEVFGHDILIKPLVGDTIGSRDTEVYTDIQDFLEVRGTAPFVLGFIGSESGKRDLIDDFIKALHEVGIQQNFVCCLYPDLNTMKRDLKDFSSSTFVSGDYINWISVVDDKASDWLITETQKGH